MRFRLLTFTGYCNTEKSTVISLLLFTLKYGLDYNCLLKPCGFGVREKWPLKRRQEVFFGWRQKIILKKT